MKKIIAFVFLMSFAAITFAQTINASLVPEVVKTKLQEKYPDSKIFYWRQSAAGFIEANFTNDGKKCNPLFVTTGSWVSTDCEKYFEQFPCN